MSDLSGEADPKEAPGVEVHSGFVRFGPHSLTPPLGWSLHEVPGGVAFQLEEPGVDVNDLPQIRCMRLPGLVESDGAARPEDLVGAHEVLEGQRYTITGRRKLPAGWVGVDFESRDAEEPESGFSIRGVIFRSGSRERLLIFAGFLPEYESVAQEAFDDMVASLIPFDDVEIFSGEPVAVDERAERKLGQCLEGCRRSYLRLWSWVAKKVASESGQTSDSRKVEIEVPYLDESTDDSDIKFFDLAVEASRPEGSCQPRFVKVTAPILKDRWPRLVHGVWESGMRCEFHALSWHSVELRTDRPLGSESLASWRERWAEGRRQSAREGDLVVGSVVHSVRLIEAAPPWTHAIGIDLGSAPSVAVWELLELARESGVSVAAFGTWDIEEPGESGVRVTRDNMEEPLLP